MSVAPSRPGPADWDALNHLLDLQDGLIHRRQALAHGLRNHDLERLVRRRLWARVRAGVFVNHTGQLTWRQNAWVGVLHFWPAALAGASAIRAVSGPGWRGHRESSAIEIVIPAGRTAAPVDGYRVTRSRFFKARVQSNTSPPRIRLEDAVIDLAATASSDLAAIGVLADSCQSRRTTAERLLKCLAERERMPRRRWLTAVLQDVADGACSVLEHAHLTRVERAHGLPRGQRQAAETRGVRRMFRDVLYPAQGVVVELDGRLFHDTAGQRDADMERDLDVAVARRETVRLGWGQCTDRACQTAGKLARILAARGWPDGPTRCGPGCQMSM